jgi:hypothetical protein
VPAGAPEDGPQALLVESADGLAAEHDALLAPGRFGGSHGWERGLARPGLEHPGLHRQDHCGGGLGSANEAGIGGEFLFLQLLVHRLRAEQEQAPRRGREDRGRQCTVFAHCVLRVFLCEVEERVELGLRRSLHEGREVWVGLEWGAIGFHDIVAVD